MVDLKKDQLSLFGVTPTPPSVEYVDRRPPPAPSVTEEPSGPASAGPKAPRKKASKKSRAKPSSETSSPGGAAEEAKQLSARSSGRAVQENPLYLFPPEPKVRPDLPFSRRMSELVRRLQLLERASKEHLNLTLPQSHAIHVLREAGSLRMQELAASLGLAQSTVTRLVAPLKRMGLLDRRPDRTDGRATRAFLTEKGAAVVDELEQADRDLYQELLGQLPETRRAEVVAAIELLHEAVVESLRD